MKVYVIKNFDIAPQTLNFEKEVKFSGTLTISFSVKTFSVELELY